MNRYHAGSCRKSHKVAREIVASLLLLSCQYAHSQTLPSKSEAGELQQLMQEEAVELTKILVQVASSRAETVLKTPSTVSVIDQKMIQDYNFRTISEAVATVPGFDVIRTAFMNTVPMSRGILASNYANKVLVMINGVPSWITVTGEGFLNRVAINDVERIEVLKGPASVLYGSNAYSGTVNIVLKEQRTEGDAGRMYGGIGTEKAYFSGVNYSKKEDTRSLFISANSSDEEGRKIDYRDQSGELGKVLDVRSPKGGNFTLLSGLSKFGQHSIMFTGYKDEWTELEGADPTYVTGAGKPQHRNGYLVNYAYALNLRDRVGVSYSLAYDWNERRFSRTRSEADLLTSNSQATKTAGYRVTNTLKAYIRLMDTLKLNLGADYEYRRVDSYRTYNPHTNDFVTNSNILNQHVYETSGFCQLEYNLNRLKLDVGTRFTHNELFGGNLSSRGSLIYALNETNSVKFIAGQSFRAPSFFELYVLTPTRSVKGNTALAPEKSDSYEVAYLSSFHKAYVQASGYLANYRNKIERHAYYNVTFPDGYFKDKVNIYENGAAFWAKGIELEMSYRAPRLLDAFINFGYVAGASRGAEQANFKFVPAYSFVGGLTKSYKSLSLSGLLRYRAPAEGYLKHIPSFTTGDLSLSYAPDRGRIKHIIAVRNVGNVLVLYPEYVRQNASFTIPSQDRRQVSYMVQAQF